MMHGELVHILLRDVRSMRGSASSRTTRAKSKSPDAVGSDALGRDEVGAKRRADGLRKELEEDAPTVA